MTVLNNYSEDYSEYMAWLNDNLSEANKASETMEIKEFMKMYFPENDPVVMKSIAHHIYHKLQLPDTSPNRQQEIIKIYVNDFLKKAVKP